MDNPNRFNPSSAPSHIPAISLRSLQPTSLS